MGQDLFALYTNFSTKKIVFLRVPGNKVSRRSRAKIASLSNLFFVCFLSKYIYVRMIPGIIIYYQVVYMNTRRKKGDDYNIDTLYIIHAGNTVNFFGRAVVEVRVTRMHSCYICIPVCMFLGGARRSADVKDAGKCER